MSLDQHTGAVLLVEDEPLIRMAAADAFEFAHVQCFKASDANEALLTLDQHPEIGLLFTDIDMPGSMDGMGLAKAKSDIRKSN